MPLAQQSGTIRTSSSERTPLNLAARVLSLTLVATLALFSIYGVYCSWCGVFLHWQRKLTGTSHGICPRCSERVLRDWEEQRDRIHNDAFNARGSTLA